MSLHAKRNITATHRRPTTVPDGVRTVQDLGEIQIGFGEEVFTNQAEVEDSVPVAEFEIFYDPCDDLKIGDFLEFPGTDGVVHLHEVRVARKFPTSKPTGYAEAEIVRKEVP